MQARGGPCRSPKRSARRYVAPAVRHVRLRRRPSRPGPVRRSDAVTQVECLHDDEDPVVPASIAGTLGASPGGTDVPTAAGPPTAPADVVRCCRPDGRGGVPDGCPSPTPLDHGWPRRMRPISPVISRSLSARGSGEAGEAGAMPHRERHHSRHRYGLRLWHHQMGLDPVTSSVSRDRGRRGRRTPPGR
jgi:hypothetical protein